MSGLRVVFKICGGRLDHWLLVYGIPGQKVAGGFVGAHLRSGYFKQGCSF